MIFPLELPSWLDWIHCMMVSMGRLELRYLWLSMLKEMVGMVDWIGVTSGSSSYWKTGDWKTESFTQVVLWISIWMIFFITVILMCGLVEWRSQDIERRCWDGAYTSSYTSSLSSSSRMGSLNLSRQEVDMYFFCIGSCPVEDWE